MKSPSRIAAVSLWFAPVVLCLGYSLFNGFTRENYGLAACVHNGLNPKTYEREDIAVWISFLFSVAILVYIRAVRPNRSGDVTLLVFVVLSYIFAVVQFAKNFHPG